MFLLVDATYIVTFNQTEYSIDENSGLVHPVLALSNSLSTATTVYVFSMNGSATGKQYTLEINKSIKEASEISS